MTTDDIMYKAFLTVWKVLRQNQSEYYYAVEKCIKQYIDEEITEEEIVKNYPEGINDLIKKQKKVNLEMLFTALLATSDDKWNKIKLLNQGKIDRFKRDFPNKPFKKVVI